MTLETICKLEKALEMDIVSDGIHASLSSSTSMLSEGKGEVLPDDLTKPEDCVTGYGDCNGAV